MNEITTSCYYQGYHANKLSNNPYSYGLEIGKYCAFEAGRNDRKAGY